jgi:hypothetical protein
MQKKSLPEESEFFSYLRPPEEGLPPPEGLAPPDGDVNPPFDGADL